MERTAAEAPAPAIGAMADAFPWAGMETAFGRPTDFEEADAFVREDEGDDADFYRTPRPVLHVDAHCAARIRSFYASRLRPGDRVLDLMCGWRSHLPEGLGAVVGLGMNEEELRSNPELTEWRAQDLNHEPGLPFASASFDAVVNTVSFEYLVNPSGVLAEARRVLRPGGVLLIALSTRYFPPKVIRLWTRLHPMERLGWVMKHLRQAGCHDVTSLVERGLARDRRDRYAPRLPEMDPLFAVAGIAP
jgi:ubiquinone/menaquinone biosynthesis C-methylase UbiE